MSENQAGYGPSWGRFEFYGAPDIDLEMKDLTEAGKRYPASLYGKKPWVAKGGKTAHDPKAGAGNFYHLKTSSSEFFFYRTGTLKNGNASGYQVDIAGYTGFKPSKAKKKSESGIDSSPWKRIEKKDVPSNVMTKFQGLMESVSEASSRFKEHIDRVISEMKKGKDLTPRAKKIRGNYELKKTSRGWVAINKGYGKYGVKKIQGKNKEDTIRQARDMWGHMNFDDEAREFDRIFSLDKIKESTEITFLKSTNSPFPEVRERRIAELKADLEEAKDRYIAIKEFPPILQRALKQVGYNRKDIRVVPAKETGVTSFGGAGKRAFAVAVDLATGRISDVARGSWGGPNPFEKNTLDVKGAKAKIPANGAVIQGVQGGGKPVYATVYIHPDSLAKLLPSGGDVTEKESHVLEIFASLKSAYRKDELARRKVTSQEIESLVTRGYLKKNKAGSVSITTKGKNERSGRLPYVGY